MFPAKKTGFVPFPSESQTRTQNAPEQKSNLHQPEQLRQLTFPMNIKLHQYLMLNEQAASRFRAAVLQLARAQKQDYLNNSNNNGAAQYPFLLFIDEHQLLVHLGPIKEQIKLSAPNSTSLLPQLPIPVQVLIKLPQIYIQQSFKPALVKDPIRLVQRPKIESIQKKITKQTRQVDTKNIPKNFSKAIINYALNNEKLCLQLFGQSEHKVRSFFNHLTEQKKTLTNIKQFSDLIRNNVGDFNSMEKNRVFRIISSYFLKKFAVNYIFNSKITQVNWHLKYKRNVQRALKNPDKFNQIKHI